MANSIRTPRHAKFEYLQNPNRPDIWDLQDEPTNPPFRYFRLSQPFAPFLIKQGAKLVVESWKDKVKTSFTGLVPINGVDGCYFGDLLMKQPEAKTKKSFIICHLQGKRAVLYLFPNFTLYPVKREAFCRKFLSTNQ